MDLEATAKAYAMTVLKRLAADSPILLAEIRQLIDAQLPPASPAFRARARREFRMRGSV